MSQPRLLSFSQQMQTIDGVELKKKKHSCIVRSFVLLLIVELSWTELSDFGYLESIVWLIVLFVCFIHV